MSRRPVVGRRWTSDRRMSRLGAAARAPIGVSVAGRQLVPAQVGPLAYGGDDAVVCPECKVGLDPSRKAFPGSSVPKHARFGYPTSTTGRPPCRGALQA